MTAAELFEAQESWVEVQGGTSRRQRRASMAEYARLKRLYPDTPRERVNGA